MVFGLGGTTIDSSFGGPVAASKACARLVFPSLLVIRLQLRFKEAFATIAYRYLRYFLAERLHENIHRKTKDRALAMPKDNCTAIAERLPPSPDAKPDYNIGCWALIKGASSVCRATRCGGAWASPSRACCFLS